MTTLAKVGRQMAAISVTIASLVKSKVANEKGQGLTEYALLIGVLAVVGVLAATVLRTPLTNLWNSVSTTLSSVTS